MNCRKCGSALHDCSCGGDAGYVSPEDSLRARVAELERERDEARRLVVGTAMFGSKCAYCGALVKVEDMNNFDGIALQLRRHAAKCPKHPSRAVEAECVELRAAVDHLLREWLAWQPGITGVARTRAEAALSRPPGSDEALRAILMQLSGMAWADLAPSREVDVRLAEAWVARLLPPATQAQGEVQP